MSEEKLIDHVVSRLEPQILDYVEVKHPQKTANLLQIVDKYEESFMNRQIRGSSEGFRCSNPNENNRFNNRHRQENWRENRILYANSAIRTLTDALVLQLPNFSEQLNLFTDASGVGIGAVLQQNQKPIAFASRTLNKAERRDHCKGLSTRTGKDSLLSKGRESRGRFHPRSHPELINLRDLIPPSQGVESIAGPSRLPDCRLNKSTTVESRTEGSGRDNKTRQTRATTRGRNKQAERPVRSNQITTRRPCPYYLRNRVKESDGILRSRGTSKSTASLTAE
ncbi:uncharacterized protein TNCV_4268631 [Trichonephila clavipes]|nr:uncharacterized protein TNCV_4268631 [Trichonephila clavipes]